DRGDAIAHVEVAARMAGDRNLAPPHQLYFGLGHVNRMTRNDIALHQTEIIEPEYRRLSVPAPAIGFVHRRLQQVLWIITPPRSSALAQTRRKNVSLAPCAQHGASKMRVSVLL